MTTRNPFDNLGKRTVRELWNTPLLRFLNVNHGFRYRYMGLPGVDLLDLHLWRDMIDEVVAFEVPAPPRHNDLQGRRYIRKLRRNLRLLGIPGHAYFGPMEEVVLLRRDYDGSAYQQNKVITLYNLDFCDEISSPIETREQGPQVWRFDAIRQIVRDQRECYQAQGGASHFVLLLTVRDQIDVQKLRGFLASNLYADTNSYLNKCGGLGSLPSAGPVLGTHTWALKAFIHNTLRQYLANPHISAVFFPLVMYTGAPVHTTGGLLESPMLHSMMLCRFDQPQLPSPSFMPANYLSSTTSVRALDETVLRWERQPGEAQSNRGDPDPANWMTQFVNGFLNARNTS